MDEMAPVEVLFALGAVAYHHHFGERIIARFERNVKPGLRTRCNILALVAEKRKRERYAFARRQRKRVVAVRVRYSTALGAFNDDTYAGQFIRAFSGNLSRELVYLCCQRAKRAKKQNAAK
jgi:hypothetical protein